MSLCALLYCRVSDVKQIKEGSGLESQEMRCREYCQSRQIPVARVFREEGVSGGERSRPAWNGLIEFIDKNPTQEFAVIVDEPKRFARDTKIHIDYRAMLDQRGVSLLSPNFRFAASKDDPEGLFIERIVACASEYERLSNRRQVQQKMASRLKAGFYCFQAPIGYKFEKHPQHGKWLVPDPETAPVIRKALKQYAIGLLSTQMDVQQFLNQYRLFETKTSIHSGLKRFLSNPIYAGYYAYEPWEVPWMKGQHEPLISLATHKSILRRLALGSERFIRNKTDQEDFALRRIIHCGHCHTPLTGSKSKGKRKRYGYYFCYQDKSCSVTPKSIPSRELEEEFCAFLERLKPSERVVEMFGKVSKKVIRDRKGIIRKAEQESKEKVVEMDRQINQVIEQSLSISSPELIQANDAKIVYLKQQKEKLLKKHDLMIEFTDVDRILESTQNLLRTPSEIWEKADIARKNALFEVFFQEPITYHRKKGFRTPQNPRLFSLSEQLLGDESLMVDFLTQNWNTWKTLLSD